MRNDRLVKSDDNPVSAADLVEFLNVLIDKGDDGLIEIRNGAGDYDYCLSAEVRRNVKKNTWTVILDCEGDDE